MNYNKLKDQAGFTLVELMVVVAIIGLLSAVAIPNFKKYQAKAKIAEAKLQLSALYTAESSFFSDYNLFHHCLTYMGYDPGPEASNRYYAVGFATPVAVNGVAISAAVNSGLDTTAGTGCPNATTAVSGGLGTVSSNASNWFPGLKGIGASVASTVGYLPASTIGDQASATNMWFTAGAGGIISEGFTTTTNSSQLRINNQKVLNSIRNGY